MLQFTRCISYWTTLCVAVFMSDLLFAQEGIPELDAGEASIYSIAQETIDRYPQSNAIEAKQAKFGTYHGKLSLERTDKAGSFTLIEELSFHDLSGRVWRAPAGTVVDGASIPKPFWTILDSPWTGEYDLASVIHDYNCQIKTEDWRRVHRLFYEGMLANGVGKTKAKIMYWAVYRFGPRWRFDSQSTEVECIEMDEKCKKWETRSEYTIANVSPIPFYDFAMVEVEVERTIEFILTDDPDLSELEIWADSGIERTF